MCSEPNVTEFVSALAAGSSAQLMVVASAGAASCETLALLAAAHQTGGRVVCIVPGAEDLQLSYKTLGHEANHIEVVIGAAHKLVVSHYMEADFVMVDSNLGSYEKVVKAMQERARKSEAIVVGYNALGKRWSIWEGLKTQLLPIGGGLLVTRIPPSDHRNTGRRSCWIVKVDEFTGEEHFFKVRLPPRKEIQV